MPDSIQQVVILGGGNLGTHLGHAIKKAGYTLLQVYSPTLRHAQALANEAGCDAASDLASLNTQADLYIFSVKDDAVHELAVQVSLPGKIVAHTSGSLPPDALVAVSKKCGVLYPLQTFTKGRPLDWKNIPICVEGADEQARAAMKDFAYKLSGHILETGFDDRRRLHLAAVFVNNFTNHLLRQAYEIAMETGLSFDVLRSLAEETIAKAFTHGPDASQTGPAVRGDESTLAAHEALLQPHPDALEVYRVLSKAIAARRGK